MENTAPLAAPMSHQHAQATLVDPRGPALLSWCRRERILKECWAHDLNEIREHDPGWQRWLSHLVSMVDEIKQLDDADEIINATDEQGYHALVSISKFKMSYSAQLREECWRPVFDMLLGAGLNPVSTTANIRILPGLFSEHLKYLMDRVAQAADEGRPYVQEDGGNLFHWPHMLMQAGRMSPVLVQQWLLTPRPCDGGLPLHLAFRDWLSTNGRFPAYLVSDRPATDPDTIGALTVPLKDMICRLATPNLETREHAGGQALYELVLAVHAAGLMDDYQRESWRAIQAAACVLKERDGLERNTAQIHGVSVRPAHRL